MKMKSGSGNCVFLTLRRKSCSLSCSRRWPGRPVLRRSPFQGQHQHPAPSGVTFPSYFSHQLLKEHPECWHLLLGTVLQPFPTHRGVALDLCPRAGHL